MAGNTSRRHQGRQTVRRLPHIQILQKVVSRPKGSNSRIYKNTYSLQRDYPPGKICLAPQKDALEKPLENHSSEHLLILLHSITKTKKEKTEPARAGKKGDLIDPKGFDDLTKGSLKIIPISSEKIVTTGNMVTIGKGDKKITFEISEWIDMKNVGESDYQKLIQMYNLIAELNEIMPSKKVKKVTITSRGDGCYVIGGYISERHEINIPLGASFLETTTHEMGHAIFRVLLGGNVKSADKFDAVKDKLWQKIYYLSLGFKNYEIVDDSNYIRRPDCIGHPYDNAGELFASSVMAYRLHPDRFIENILDPDTDEKTREVGKLIFLYLRDKIFSSKVFSKSDPFESESIEPVKIENAEIITSLIKALGDSDWRVSWAAAEAIVKLGLKDKEFVEPLIKALGDGDSRVCQAAAKAIGELGLEDERFVDPLIKALRSSFWSVRKAAAKAIGELGLKDERFIDPLIKALSDDKYLVRAEAAKALGKIGNAMAVPALRKLIDKDPAEIVRKIAQEAIAEIKKNTNL